jgi:hypothetical protein
LFLIAYLTNYILFGKEYMHGKQPEVLIFSPASIAEAVRAILIIVFEIMLLLICYLAPIEFFSVIIDLIFSER